LKTGATKAFTLIETLAVVMAVAFLAAAVLLPMIKRLDMIAAKKETDALKAMAEAYKERVSDTKIIPNQNGWAAEVALQLGANLKSITNNIRGLRRVFLIDPALAIGKNSSPSLPYIQLTEGHIYTNGAGVIIPPVSPRLMLISSMSGALPTNLVSGVGAVSGAMGFSNIWATPEASVPTGWTWGGRGEDLKVERFSLADQFVHVILNNRDTNFQNISTNLPRYKIDDSVFGVVPFGGRRMYFIKGTELKLFSPLGVLEYSEVLSGSKSFTFEFGTWQGEAFVANTVSQTSPLDLQRVMNTFMNSPTNPAAKFGANQLAVSNAMVLFLNEYIQWRDAGYPGQFQGQGNPPKTLSDAQAALKTVSANLLTP
jgi:type II secretory pathway pseudopilin PulG